MKNTATLIDEFEYLYILGNKENNYINPIDNITLIGNFYDINGKLLIEYYLHRETCTLNPFENSSFQIIHLDPLTSE